MPRTFRVHPAGHWSSVALTLCAGAVWGCGSSSSESDQEPVLRPTATIQDIMLSMVDPKADVVWNSTATIVHQDGRIEDRRPETDEDWAALRHAAIVLVEAANLLVMEGREVADPGVESENPGIELEPEEIEALIAEDRATWTRLVHEFQDTSRVMLDAVRARDADRVFEEGGPLDEACERCHQQYWYPDDPGRPAITDPLVERGQEAADVLRRSSG